MATAPATTPAPALGFQPAFKRVAQEGTHDDLFACIATIAGKTLEEVRATAIKLFNHPANGPYWIDENLTTALFAHYGWVNTVWRPVETPIAGLPDLAVLLIDYDEEKEIGRTVVFHRLRPTSGPKPVIEYVIDPATWISPQKQIQAELKALQPAWALGIHPMNTTAVGTKK